MFLKLTNGYIVYDSTYFCSTCKFRWYNVLVIMYIYQKFIVHFNYINFKIFRYKV